MWKTTSGGDDYQQREIVLRGGVIDILIDTSVSIINEVKGEGYFLLGTVAQGEFKKL